MIMASEKLTSSWLTCDNKTRRQWFGRIFSVEFNGEFEHSDIIGTNPYLVLHASNIDIQDITAWIDIIILGYRIVDLHDIAFIFLLAFCISRLLYPPPNLAWNWANEEYG
jgi:hypothetical protein